MLIAVIVVYLLVMLGIGIWANKYNNDTTDFLLAGRRLGLGLATFTLVATYFGGGMVMGYAETAYTSGLVTVWNGIGSGLGFIALGFMAFKLRDLALFTVPDFLMHRFNSNIIRILSSIVSLIALIGILGGNVGAASAIMEMLGIGEGMTAAIIACLIFVIYTSIGGLWAATITDFVQIILAGGGVIIAIIVASGNMGGWNEVVSKITETDVSGTMLNIFGTGNVSYILWLTIPILLYGLIGQDIYQRVFATKSPKVARNACFIAGGTLIALSFITVMLGIIGKVMYPNLSNPANVLPNLVIDSFHPIISGIVLAALVAAIMSTADSILTASTAHIINDIYINTIYKGKKEDLDEKKMLMFARICTVIVGIFAVIAAGIVPRILSLMLYSYTLFTSGVFVPVVGGYIWKSATKQGALAAMISGFTVAVLSFFGITFLGIPTDIFASLISLIAFIIVSLLTQKGRMNKNE